MDWNMDFMDGLENFFTNRSERSSKCQPRQTARESIDQPKRDSGAKLICSKDSAMSLRGVKRASNRAEEPGVSGTAVCKRRKTEPEDTQWQSRSNNDLKLSSNFNRSVPEGPAELFRKDLISAMKLPDSEPLAADEYWVITDPWKQEWERGVQVPVNPDSLPEPAVTEIRQRPSFQRHEFKLPKKYVRLSKDSNFNSSEHYLSCAVARAESACAYDMDACDAAWLRALNGERARAGAQPLHEEQLERVIEELEVRCWDKIQAIIKSEEGLGIEFDENVICDVCRSPDSEEGNEMVFCDSCNICVHQACYGITAIPSGQWLCSPCADGVRPVCVLCPNHGGAMKCTPSRHKWAHVSCVLWIPEVSIGCAERMEPITKISAIPPSRWSLICILCRERTGACIQCSVKTCKTAYHVTCAFKYGLEMRAIIEDENADDGVKLRSYCQRHSVNSKKDKNNGSGSEEDESKRKRRKDMTSEEKSQARAIRLHEIEAEFDRHVSIKDISTHLLDVDQDGIQYMYNYWKLKRKAGHNRPLLPPKTDETDMLMHRQEQADIDKKRMFVQLRQDLERVRNLCYMVSRREKLSRSYFKMREQTFHKQVAMLTNEPNLSSVVVSAVIEANHGPSIYDRLYSCAGAVDHTDDFDSILSLISGTRTKEDAEKDLNGLMKRAKPADTPRRLYFNGSARRSASLYSGISSGAESIPDREIQRSQTKYHRPIYSTTDDEEADRPPQPPKKKVSPKSKDQNAKVDKRKSRQTPASRSKIESSSEEELPKKVEPMSRTLRQLAKEMAARPVSGTESDELMMPQPYKKHKLTTNIYSDSEASDSNKNEDVNEDKSSNATSDSQQHPFRTKAAVKEFNPVPKGNNKNAVQVKKQKPTESDDEKKPKESTKTAKNKDYPSDLIVPQRQAAKKASENMRSTTVSVKSKDQNEPIPENKPPPQVEDPKLKNKQKVKEKRKETKDISPRDATKKEVKVAGGNDVFEFETEVDKDPQDKLAYVPQRQAAKKAAEHIKSGLSKAPEAPIEPEPAKKPAPEMIKSPKKEEEKKSKIDKSSSSSSSSSTSTSSSSSSSSESEEETAVKLPVKRTLEKKSVAKSLFSPPRRTTIDLPFLDKGSKVGSSSSPSSDSEANKDTSFDKSKSNISSPRGTRQKKPSPSITAGSSKSAVAATQRKNADKKLKAADGVVEPAVFQRSPVEREKPLRTSTGPAPRASARARTRSITTGPGNIPDRKDAGQGKSAKDKSASPPAYSKDFKEDRESGKLPFAERKTDKKLKLSSESLFSPPKKADVNISSDTKKDENPHKVSKLEASIERRKEKQNQKESSRKVEQSSVASKVEPFMAKSVDNSNPELENKKRDLFEPKKTSNVDCQIKEKDITVEKIKKKSPTKSSTKVVKTPELENQVNESKSRQHESKEDAKPIKIPLESSEQLKTQGLLDNRVEHHEIENIDKSNKPSFLQPPYPNRSIFSPPAIKDTGCSEFFDFGNDILAVDETVHDDGFNIAQGSDEIMKSTPLPFFNTDLFLFKEDSKEDRGVRETLHLVEKLRMKMLAKIPSTAGNQDENVEKSMPTFPECDAFDKNEKQEEIKESDCNVYDDIKESKEATENIPCNDSIYNLNQKSEASYHSVDETASYSSQDSAPKFTEPQVQNQDNFSIEKSEQTNQFHVENILDNNAPMLQNEIQPKPMYIQEHEKSFENQMQMDNMNNVIHPHPPPLDMQVAPHKDLTEQNKEAEMERQNSMQNFENDHPLQPPECTPMSSPYNSIRQQTKWSEMELIPARRSSTSSATSETSSTSHKQDDIEHSKQVNIHNSTMQNINYQSFHPCPVNTSPYAQFSSEASQFVGGPVPIFPPVTINSDLPPPLFPTNLNLSYTNPGTMLPQISKLNEEPVLSFPTTCSAAFTSSSHNMALTTAMIAPLTPKPVSEHSSNHEEEQDLTSPANFPSPMTNTDEFSNSALHTPQVLTETSNISSASPMSGKKSPSKPTRTSSRFVPQQIKSPSKSPSKSPKGDKANRRGVSRNSRGSGRGRGRPRGKSAQNVRSYMNMDMGYPGIGNTIHTKLVGTVYDLNFDEDIANDNVSDLKSMRERRRSTDIHDRKSESYHESSQSPKFTSPSQVNKRTYSTDIKELRPPSPISNIPSTIESTNSPVPLNASVENVPPFTNIVQPVLPGPVDMRSTYSAFEPTNTDAFNNHLLGAFASGTADQQFTEIDEEVEKELHSALIASSNKSQEPVEVPSMNVNTIRVERAVEEPPQIHEFSIPKVSLTDPRNQLKVKIKGPFLDANYSASCVTPVVQQPSIPIMEQQPGVQNIGTPSAVGSSAMLSGTSSLRRMRKKELLRQYCTQDMNMDDPSVGIAQNQVAPPVVQTFSRTVISIPKAVASMTSIPTREDYKAVVDANMEKKRRKMRHLDDESDDMTSSLCHLSTPSQLALSYKRRGRIAKPQTPTISNVPIAPKLKIKLGNYMSEHTIDTTVSKYDCQFRPPKKRLSNIQAKPSVEDLRRESMKFRRMVMADFEGGEKDKKKRGKSKKRKKKRDKRSSEIHVVDKQSEDSTKLVIRLLRKDDSAETPGVSGDKLVVNQTSEGFVPAASAVPSEEIFVSGYDPTAPDPLALDPPSAVTTDSKTRTTKVSPIRLKLSRGAGGSGYVMKDSPSTSADDPATLVEQPNADALNCPSMAHNKHCEVR